MTFLGLKGSTMAHYDIIFKCNNAITLNGRNRNPLKVA